MVVAILLGSLAYFLQQYSGETVYKEIEKNKMYSLSQLSQNIENLMLSYEQLVDFMFTNDEVQNRISTVYSSTPEAYYMYADFIEPLSSSILGSMNVLNFKIYTDNESAQMGIIRPIEEAYEQEWYKDYKINPRKSRSWTPVEDNNKIIRLTQRLNNFELDAEMYMTVDVEIRHIFKFIAKEDLNQRYLVAFPDGTVLFDREGSSTTLGGQLQDEFFYEALKEEESGSRLIENDGKNSLLMFRTLQSKRSLQGIKVISLIPIDGLLAKVNDMKKVAISLFLLSLILSFLLMYIITASLTKKLIKMAKGIKQMNMEMLQPLQGIQGDDEIGYLSRVFNDMIIRLNKLIEEEYKSKLKSKELQLKAKESQLYELQAQINPHYLFNTLNAIRGSLLKSGDQKHTEIVDLFAQSFRNLLNRKGQVVKLSDELEMVNTYLRVQMIRFGERLIYEINVPESLREQAIPSLSLQTLVENVIIHVLEKKPGITVILIESKLTEQGDYLISVEDNGPGLTMEQCSFVKSKFQDQSDTDDSLNIGLRNIHQRLQLLFGENYGLEIESEIGFGTKIGMRLPQTNK